MLRVAEPGKRFLARLLDGLIVGVPAGILTLIIIITLGQPPEEFAVGFRLGPGAMFLILLAFYGIYFLYDCFMHAFAGGQTVGKKVLKTRVVRADGARLSGGGAVGRSAVLWLPPLTCIGYLFTLVNVVSLLWDKPYQQCYHDKASSTVVVETG